MGGKNTVFHNVKENDKIRLSVRVHGKKLRGSLDGMWNFNGMCPIVVFFALSCWQSNKQTDKPTDGGQIINSLAEATITGFHHFLFIFLRLYLNLSSLIKKNPVCWGLQEVQHENGVEYYRFNFDWSLPLGKLVKLENLIYLPGSPGAIISCWAPRDRDTVTFNTCHRVMRYILQVKDNTNVSLCVRCGLWWFASLRSSSFGSGCSCSSRPHWRPADPGPGG